MNRRQILLTVILVSLVTITAACGGGGADVTPEPPVESTLDPIEQAVNQTVAAVIVEQTVTALTNNQQATTIPPAVTDSPPPTAEEVAANPTAEPTTEVVVATLPPAPTAEQELACVTVSGVNVRSGPGTVFDPPIGTLPGNTALTPLSFVSNGFPGGQWLEAQVTASGQIVWISNGAQFLSCNFELTSLPGPASLPATPQPTRTPTPIPVTATRVVAGLPPNVSNNTPGGACEDDSNIVAPEPVVDPNYLFRVRARDIRGGEHDGAGIDFVRFEVFKNFDDFGGIYQREERTAGFCIFQGGEPDCYPWPSNDQGQFTWGAGGPVVESGEYHVSINIVSDFPPEGSPEGSDPETCNWDFDITVDVAP